MGGRLFSLTLLQLAVEQGLLDLADSSRHVDAARARLHAVENRPAAPHALGGVQDFQAVFRALVAAVKNEAMSGDDRRRPNVVRVGPERRAGSGAGAAQDAARRVLVALALAGCLQS